MRKLIDRAVLSNFFWLVLVPTALAYFIVVMICYAIDNGGLS